MEIRNKVFNYYENIDCLRTLSCFGIIAMHIRANTKYQINSYIYNTVIASWTWFVYLFLIISGFSMCCGYYEQIAKGTINIEKFYIRRFKKIVPFFSCLVVFAVIVYHTPEAVFEGIMELTMAFGLLPNNTPQIVLGVCWTLGVIFLFYMLFPYFVFLLLNKHRAWLTLVVSLVINHLCTVYFFTERFVINEFTPRHSFIFCTPFLFGGGILYLYKESIEKFVKKYRWIILFICITATVCWYIVYETELGIKVFIEETLFLFALWLSYAISIKSRFMGNKIMKYFGGISMEMYLSHMIVFRLIEKLNLLYIFGFGWRSFIAVWIMDILLLIMIIEAYKKIMIVSNKHRNLLFDIFARF